MVKLPKTPIGDVRERVLQAALALLAEQGVRKLTQPQVAQRAEVRQGHLTYYFPKRSDLIRAVAERYVESAGVEMMKLLSDASPESLPELLMGFAFKQISDRGRARVLLGLMVAAEEDPQLREQLARSMNGLRMLIASAMGVPVEDPAATIMQATLWGLGINNLLMMEETDEEELQGLIDYVARQTGLKKKAKEHR